jgi:hypothetical protein
LGNKADFQYFPYLIIENFVRTFFSTFPINDENIIVLCELSLNSLNPGLHLVHILEKMDQEGYIINNYEDIYQLYFANLTYFQDLSKLNKEYSSIFDLSKGQLKNLFKGDKEVSLRTWCEDVINNAQTLHEEQWRSFLFDKDESMRKSKIVELMKRTGLPFIYNNRDQYYCDEKLEKVEQRILLRAVHDVLNVFNGNFIGCSMKSFCEISDPLYISSGKGVPSVDDRCDSAPWERCRDSRLCAFSMLWYKWGLKDYSPKKVQNGSI